MDFKFGPFGNYLIFTAFILWYITLPAGLLLLWVCLRRKNKPWLRWMSGIGAAPLLFPFLVFGWVSVKEAINDSIANREYRQKEKEHTVILKQPETVAGIALSAGDTVFYNFDFDMGNRQQAQLTDIQGANLSKPARFLNLEVKRIAENAYYGWDILLARDQQVLGWPCTGYIVLTKDGRFVSGTLSTEHVIGSYIIPKGSMVVDNSEELLRITLPDSKTIAIDKKTKQPVVEGEE
ncbi:hypothetical protein SAMN04488128_102551 [Chitinophaga eiseniae]|uniref:Uncharacterized protein n=1 Tax=Chitinophaga eiseniae TaxID=634771 RepID=A0A1T4QRJ8_9BACT|nr:hypothetical protein [Chitinophaga eiseniae]SKA06403.1 hypothetical protein SAMN04488128_102551 [Chitinophaga eiseniae]